MIYGIFNTVIHLGLRVFERGAFLTVDLKLLNDSFNKTRMRHTISIRSFGGSGNFFGLHRPIGDKIC